LVRNEGLEEEGRGEARRRTLKSDSIFGRASRVEVLQKTREVWFSYITRLWDGREAD